MQIDVERCFESVLLAAVGDANSCGVRLLCRMHPERSDALLSYPGVPKALGIE